MYLIRVYETFVFYSFFVCLVVLYILTCFKSVPLRLGLFVSLKNPLDPAVDCVKKVPFTLINYDDFLSTKKYATGEFLPGFF